MRHCFSRLLVQISVSFCICLLLNCFNIPNNLQISIFDIKPDISKNFNVTHSGDSIIVMFDHEASFGILDFAYNLSLSDYNGIPIYTTIDSADTVIILDNISDNISGQKWNLSVLGYYQGNSGVSDTVDTLILIDVMPSSIHLSPSLLNVDLALDSSFYIEVYLDDIIDSILAGEVKLQYDTNTLTLDSTVYPESDSLFYFKTGNGSIQHFIQDSLSNSPTLAFAFYKGKVNGLPGSGKIIQLFFRASRPGFCKISLLSGRLKDIYNKDVPVELKSSLVQISYMEN